MTRANKILARSFDYTRSTKISLVVVNTLVLAIFSYGKQTWGLDIKQKINAVMDMARRMFKIP